VHLICPSLSFLAEAQPRLKTGKDKRHFFAEVHIKFFRRPHELQSKTHHWKNYKCISYLPFLNIYIHIIVDISYHSFAIQLLIYIIYGDRTIIGFVGFVANLLNRPTDGATDSVRKRVTFRPLVST
jgi:hypothetical protein